MLAPYALALIGLAVVVTSFISGMFGMAGGMLLLGLLLLCMDVAPAMLLFASIQLAANSWRAVLWRRHVAWSIVLRFLVGSTAMFLVMRTIAILPSKAAIYIGLGLIPFAAYALPRQLTLEHFRLEVNRNSNRGFPRACKSDSVPPKASRRGNRWHGDTRMILGNAWLRSSRMARAHGRRQDCSISAPRRRSAGSSAGPRLVASRQSLAPATPARRSSSISSGCSHSSPGSRI